MKPLYSLKRLISELLNSEIFVKIVLVIAVVFSLAVPLIAFRNASVSTEQEVLEREGRKKQHVILAKKYLNEMYEELGKTFSK